MLANPFKMSDSVFPKTVKAASKVGVTERNNLTFHRQRPGLAALQLGETVVGKPTDLQHLHGKVVLWRSFSL